MAEGPTAAQRQNGPFGGPRDATGHRFFCRQMQGKWLAAKPKITSESALEQGR